MADNYAQGNCSTHGYATNDEAISAAEIRKGQDIIGKICN
jgi:hypothetical protein